MGDVDSAITQHASERLSARLSALDLGGTVWIAKNVFF